MTGPLADVQILDTSPFLPGPFATQMLADLGANVIKVEPPTGDPGRHVPGGLHETTNRNKRSIVLDLKSEQDRERCHRLAAGADVFVEGFRPGVVDRLGVSYAELSADNPGLVYCSVSGFGQTEPKRSTPGHDATYLAAAGALAVPGSWSDPRPHRSGIPVADLGTSNYVAVAILAALHERHTTGRGCYLDVAITDVALALASARAGEQLDNDGADRLHLNPSNDLFDTADGMLAVAAVEEHFWQRLRAVLLATEPQLGDPRFDGLAGRRANGDDLSALLQAVFMTRTAKEWISLLTEADIPAEVVHPVREAVESEQVRRRGIVQAAGDQRHVTFPVVQDGRPMGSLRTTAAAAGADSATVFAMLDRGTDPWAASEEDA